MDFLKIEEGSVLDGRYKLIKRVGDGGSAIVYLADDILIGRQVAVKILKEDDDENTNTKSFLTEIQAVAVLSHPNIVNVYDVAVKDDFKYIVMEYVDGITLRKYMTHKGRSDCEEVINCASQVLAALEAAHAGGVVHRDIKPQNIMLIRDGTIRVTDFGIASLPSGDEMTMEGRAVGTVYYISPEQARGKAVDARSDIYSLGVMMYEMATGSLPFEGDDPSAVAMKQITDKPKRPRDLNPDISEGLEQIILAAMEKSPDRRFQSAAAMLAALEKLEDNPGYVFKNTRTATKKSKGDTMKVKITKVNVIIPILVAIIAALAIILTLILVNQFSTPSGDDDEYITVEMPNLVDSIYSVENYASYLNNQHLDIEVIYHYHSSPEGTVLNQSIEAGTIHKIKKGDTIPMIIYVSYGPRDIELGYVEGHYSYVIDQLRRAYGDLNFKVVRIWEYNDTVPEDNVVRWESTTSADVIVGSIVTLYISAGPEAEKYITKVPNLVGMNATEAIEALEEAGLHVGNIEYVVSADSGKNMVLSQETKEGTELYAKINTVDITVGGGISYGE